MKVETTTLFHSQIEQNFIRSEQKYVRTEQNVENKIELNKKKFELNRTEMTDQRLINVN